MPKNPEDRRAKRTKKLLKESLLDLMRQKRFAEISIRDITEHADVNRSTFYLHYADTTQLLWSMEKDLLAQAQTLVDAHIQETMADGTVRPLFEPVLNFVVQNREICTLLLENNEASQFTAHLQRLIQDNGAEIVRARFHPRDERVLPYLMGFITSGLIGLIMEWFRRDMDLPQAELLKAAELLADGATAQLLKETKSV